MKVRALNSFSDSVHGSRAAGDEFELPEGADWLRAGLVEAVTEPEPEPEPEAPTPAKSAGAGPARKKAKGG